MAVASRASRRPATTAAMRRRAAAETLRPPTHPERTPTGRRTRPTAPPRTSVPSSPSPPSRARTACSRPSDSRSPSPPRDPFGNLYGEVLTVPLVVAYGVTAKRLFDGAADRGRYRRVLAAAAPLAVAFQGLREVGSGFLTAWLPRGTDPGDPALHDLVYPPLHQSLQATSAARASSSASPRPRSPPGTCDRPTADGRRTTTTSTHSPYERSAGRASCRKGMCVGAVHEGEHPHRLGGYAASCSCSDGARSAMRGTGFEPRSRETRSLIQIRPCIDAPFGGSAMRGTGFEPADLYRTAPSTLRRWPGLATHARRVLCALPRFRGTNKSPFFSAWSDWDSHDAAGLPAERPGVVPRQAPHAPRAALQRSWRVRRRTRWCRTTSSEARG